MKRKAVPARDKFGRFVKRGSKTKPPQRRDKFGRFLPSKRKPKHVPRKRKKSLPKKSHLSPSRKPTPEPLRFRPLDYEEDEELGDDEMELEQEWQDKYEDDFSGLDRMDDLDNLLDDVNEWYDANYK